MMAYLETVLDSLWVNFLDRCSEGVSDELLNLREYVTLEVKVQFRVLCTNDFREILEAHFVTVFELTVVFGLLLYRVVC